MSRIFINSCHRSGLFRVAGRVMSGCFVLCYLLRVMQVVSCQPANGMGRVRVREFITRRVTDRVRVE